MEHLRYMRVDAAGNILLLSAIELIDTFYYTDLLPEDYQKSGKYLFLEGAFVPNADYIDHLEIIAAQVVEPISHDPLDETIERRAVVEELPIRFNLQELQLLVTLQHYRHGAYIGLEKANRKIVLTTDETEFTNLYQAVNAGMNMIELIRQYIHVRDNEGRFN